jgi:esterase/lipase superfamily enzyme
MLLFAILTGGLVIVFSGTSPSAWAGNAALQSAAAVEPGESTIVKVYYATDRARLDAAAPASVNWSATLGWALAAWGIALVLMAIAKHYRKTRLLHCLSVAFSSMTLMAAIWTAYQFWREQLGKDSAAEDKITYGGERGELDRGSCSVAIPEDHAIGRLESPSIWHFDFKEDPQRHIVLMDVESLTADKFHADLKDCVSQSAEKEALVFVHGYNVKFSDAVRRTAQIACDLKFDGAAILYSWPSQGKLSGYTIDETNVEWTVSHLKQLLAEITAQSGAQHVHLIAHSMGSRALAAALQDLARGLRNRRPKFGEVVLTAPDIDADMFQHDIAPAIVRIAERVTLYASSNDEALKASQEVHGYPRAGGTDDELVIVPGVDTIDVSAVDTSLIGHSYYGSNGTVLSDLFDLLHENRPPDERQWLRAQYLGSLKYWVFQR